VVTSEGLPLAYEVMAGNTADSTTLRDFLDRIEHQYGKARRIWVMDRGIPTEAVLEIMRQAETQFATSSCPPGAWSMLSLPLRATRR
jgi:transposase